MFKEYDLPDKFELTEQLYNQFKNALDVIETIDGIDSKEANGIEIDLKLALEPIAKLFDIVLKETYEAACHEEDLKSSHDVMCKMNNKKPETYISGVHYDDWNMRLLKSKLADYREFLDDQIDDLDFDFLRRIKNGEV
jgi:hypothetical protein